MGKLECLSPRLLKDESGFNQMVRCNHCINCLVRRKLGWTLRICLEYRSTGSGVFVTHTYNEEARKGFLDYRDIQLCLKRFRKSIQTPVRFFSCGQYGAKHGREHWHTIFFGVTLARMADLLGVQLEDTRGLGLEGLADQPTAHWPHGSTHIGDFNVHRARYVASYVLKTGGPRDQRPENVVQMSRKPGIGLDELRQISRYLYSVKPSWDRVPCWWKVDGSLYPLDAKARSTLVEAFKEAGGTILHENKSALVRHSEARIAVIAGDAMTPKAAVDLRMIDRKELERTIF